MEKPIYSEVCDFENLYQAARETIGDKKYHPEELRFAAGLEENLIEIQNELVWHTYRPGGYHKFWVYDPKKRLICAPGLKDRIVQTALCRVLERYIIPRLDYDSYACIGGKGALAAAQRAALFAGRHAHFLYLDVGHFFDSVPILPLEEIYRKRFIDDSEVMRLLHAIFMNDCGGVGLKKGCRTSQLSANVRYMDDFLIFSGSEENLKDVWERLSEFTEKNYFLKFNRKSHIGRTSRGLEFVGYRIFPKYKIVRKAALDRAAQAMRAWRNGKVDDTSFYKGAASRAWHCEGTASYKWCREYLLKALKFALVDRNAAEE